ncbi:MAG: hypothetical protein AAF415_11805 [Pseudomonadota bacterium]
MTDARIELLLRHLDTLFVQYRTLIYGIFVLTFAGYLAMFSNEPAKQVSTGNQKIGFVCGKIGNALWAFLAFRIAGKIILVSDLIEESAELPDTATGALMACTGLRHLCWTAALGLIAANWGLFVVTVLGLSTD